MSEYKLPELSRRRRIVNLLTQRVIGVGGIAVIAAIVMIMGYLIWVIVPIFVPASIDELNEAGFLPSDVLHIGSDDSFETLSLIRSSGAIEFRDPSSFVIKNQARLSPDPIKSAQLVFPTSDTYVIRDANDTLRFFRIVHQVRYLGGERKLEQRVESLFNGSSHELPPKVTSFDTFRNEDDLRVVARSSMNELHIVEYEDIDDEIELEFPDANTIESQQGEFQTYFGPRGRFIFEVDESTGEFRVLIVASVLRPRVLQQGTFSNDGQSPKDIELLLGRYSFLVSDNQGSVAHWAFTPSDQGTLLKPIRTTEFDHPIVTLKSEQRRKGYAAVDANNEVHLAYTTSNRILTSARLNFTPTLVAHSPRADRLIAYAGSRIQTFVVDNPHPEISWRALWGKVWYEGYEEPVFSWQSSSADTDFEPKFSLTPLLFGTIKAAFYAMLFAIPMAVAGAIYTANFMSPSMRAWVKPGIEIMAALPTVILGFLAGLWLSPIIEAHITSVLLCAIIIPVGMLLFSTLWSRLPSRIVNRCDGWSAAITVPVIVLLGWITLEFDESLASLIFGGDAKNWMYEKLGLEYDQRNALIIGIAMGLAVIPTIFSIAEDAIYGVPQHLVHGSLALGATRWQTLVRVVLLTASPGIFSAIMIGFGRAVGETMIVLMATGNTPIMDLNLFQGMRTFAANIAVEMPESEANSTHFRILFLTALVLFMITFAFNTAAEIVRHRLRVRYGNL